jgi:hypothetical protein
MSAQQFFRKYLDILNEQSVPPVGAYIDPNTPPDIAAKIKAMDQAGRGEIDKGYYDNQSPEVKAAMLRQVNQAPQNPNAQTADQRAAGFQAKIDQGQMTKAQAAKNAGSGEYFQDPKKSDPTTTKSATTKPAIPAPASTPAPQVNADPIDFQARAGTQPIADTGLGKLSGGVSLGGSASNYMTPSMRAELANQSGGKFVADIGQNRQQLGYQQDLGNGLTGQLALNRNAQGGMSAGIGAEKQVNPNLSFGGGISAPISGQGSARGDIYGKYTFEEELEEELKKILKLSGKSSKN